MENTEMETRLAEERDALGIRPALVGTWRGEWPVGVWPQSEHEPETNLEKGLRGYLEP